MLCPVLHRLERLRYIQARWEVADTGRKRKYYKITKQGREQLSEQFRQWQAVDATLRGIWRAIDLSVKTPPSHRERDPMTASNRSLEALIDRWRDYLRRRQAIQPLDVAELEDHLREQVTSLNEAGLAED